MYNGGGSGIGYLGTNAATLMNVRTTNFKQCLDLVRKKNKKFIADKDEVLRQY